MASKTEIANHALLKLGETRVSNIETDIEKKSKTIRELWNEVRDALLEAYPWNFAIKRVSIAADGTAPVYGWDNAFSVPVDFLKLLYIKDTDEYVIENGKILTDTDAPLYITYVARITDTSRYNPLFNEALACRLAFDACESITQSNTKKEFLYKEYMQAINTAFQSDAIQDPPQDVQESPWVTARFTGVTS